jgi:hypothetical protein
MNVDARISTALPEHPKAKKLARRLGGAGCWSLVCLFLWCARNRASGDLAGMTDEDVELAANWTGTEGELVKALSEVRFLDGESCAYRIHDWAEHNPWAAGAAARSDAARTAARARWESAGQCDPHAQSMRDASGGYADGMRPAENRNAPFFSSPSQNQTQNQQPARAAPAPSAVMRFAEFWEAYPSKTGKKPAEEKWRQKRLDAHADAIIADVRKRITKDRRWLDGFIPNPSTYLHQERWNDEMQQPAQRMQDASGTHAEPRRHRELAR